MEFLLYNPDVLSIIKSYSTVKSWNAFASINRDIRAKYHKSYGLHSNQLCHFGVFMDILLQYKSVIDVSIMGAGKTHICIAAIKELHARAAADGRAPQQVFVYTTHSATVPWRDLCDTKYTTIYNHHALANEKNDGCLIRRVMSAKNKNVLVPSQWLMTYCDIMTAQLKYPECTMNRYKSKRRGAGVIIIVDEAHVIKNVGADRTKYASALFKYARMHAHSYVILASATIIDKPNMYSVLLKHTGIITHSRLFTVLHNTTQYLGLADMDAFVARYCGGEERMVWARQRHELMQRASLGMANSTALEKFKTAFFNNYVKRRLVCGMTQPAAAIKPIIENKFCNPSSHEDLLKSMKLLQKLKGILSYDDNTHTVTRNGLDNSSIEYVLEGIEGVTVRIICRLAVEALAANPKTRVVCMFNFRSSLVYAYEILKSYRPLVIYGETSLKLREEACMHFRANLDRRLLIGNTEACCYGISLDDVVGDYPRVSFISPEYSLTRMHQVAYRTCRMTTRSVPRVYYVYIKSALYADMLILLKERKMLQLNIINSIMNKSVVLRNIISNTDLGDDVNYKFPAEYPYVIEADVGACFWH